VAHDRSATVALAMSFLLYIMVQMFSWHVPAWPSGELYFNPLAWQLLFVFGAWYVYEGAGRLRTITQSRVVLVLALLYLAFSLAIALSWEIKPLEAAIPEAISKLIYPTYKSHLSPLRVLHFLALAILVSRLTAPDWHGPMKPWMIAVIRCGENSLTILLHWRFAVVYGLRNPVSIFHRDRHAGCHQYCRHRPHDRRSDSDDLDFQTGPAWAKAVLRRSEPALRWQRCGSRVRPVDAAGVAAGSKALRKGRTNGLKA
jgi:hypothetical protein